MVEIVFLMLILKLPIVYLCGVVWYAIRAEPKPPEAAIVPAELRPGPLAAPRRARASAACAAGVRTDGPRGARSARAWPARAPGGAGERPARRGPRRSRPAETVAGFIAAAALAVGVIAIVYRPVRLSPPALLVALIAVGIGGRFSRLAAAAVAVITVGWVLGMIYGDRPGRTALVAGPQGLRPRC